MNNNYKFIIKNALINFGTFTDILIINKKGMIEKC